jgi:hypothetical protein
MPGYPFGARLEAAFATAALGFGSSDTPNLGTGSGKRCPACGALEVKAGGFNHASQH